MNNHEWAENQLKRWYPQWIGVSKGIDTAFAESIVSKSRVLDAACGKGLGSIELSRHRDRIVLVGIDVNAEDVGANPILHLKTAGDVHAMPFASHSFRLVASIAAVEHLMAPKKFFQEVFRILAPGGTFVIMTSNLASLPILISKLSPLGLHQWIYRHLYSNQSPTENFPTFYRANTGRMLTHMLGECRFRNINITYYSFPQYWATLKITFPIGILYEKVTDIRGLQFLKPHLLRVCTK